MLSSKAGKKLFIVEGFKFRFHKSLTKGVERWACVNKKCKSYVKISNEIVIESKIDHNHEQPTEERLIKEKFNNSVKRKATENISDRTRKLINSELEEAEIDVLNSRDLVNIRKNIHKATSSVHSRTSVYKSFLPRPSFLIKSWFRADQVKIIYFPFIFTS